MKYRALADALVKQYQKQGVSVSKLVDNQTAKAKQNGRELSRPEAFDEVVADSMESMLTDENAAAFLEKLSQRDKGLKEKIVSWLKELAAKLKNALTAYKDVKPDSPEGKMVAEMEEFRKEIMGIYTSALVDAGENFRENGGNKKSTQEGGDVRYMVREGILTENTSEQERYELLRNQYISFAEINEDAIKDINLEECNTRKKSAVTDGLVKLAQKLGILNVDLKNSEIEFTFQYSTGNFRKSIHHQLEYGGTYQDYVKAMSCFMDLIENAVPIEIHNEKKTGTTKANKDLKLVYVLVSGFKDDLNIVPVQMEVKTFWSSDPKLYLTVALTKIDSEVLEKAPESIDADTPLLFPESTYSLQSLFKNVNPKDGRFLKYVPDGFLYNEQKLSKKNALEKQEQEYDLYRFSDRDPTAEATRAALEKENGKLREDVSRLRELLRLQGKVTGGTVPKQSSVEAAAKWLNKYAGAKADVKELSGMLTDFYKFLATDKDYSWDDVHQRAMVIARHLQDNVQIKQQISDYARDVLREVRGTKITLGESQRAEVERMYGSYEAFRKAAFGTVTFVKEGGIPLDSQWQEWSTMFPGTFDSEITASDQPRALMDAINALRNSDTTVMEYAYNRERN
ncbi:MAG: hypothetical protein MR763_10715 [Clostridiales bacterium]|nr:hypothetical protein [Clostridiales bacterium]